MHLRTRWLQRPLFSTPDRLSAKLAFFTPYSSKCPQVTQRLQLLDGECDDFLPWLERKAGIEISSALFIGKSTNGRSLFASKFIEYGDCMLKVPFNVQISPDHLFPEVKSFLSDEVGNVAKLAIVLLIEQKKGQVSEWGPYISRLPLPQEMQSTIFWSEDELEMIQKSSVYEETLNQKALIEKEFLASKQVLDHFPEHFGDITLMDFMHAYALVASRAWGSMKGVSMIPFADFLNHDGASEAVVLSDEHKHISEVIADRNYLPGEEVLIRYGKFSNATLLLDFGFTIPYNIYDQVQVKVNIPPHDFLRRMKLDLLRKHLMPAVKDVNSINPSWDTFTLKEVRSARGKGKGIPQALRAFARVLCSTSPEELSDLAMEAKLNDGRLGRRPLKSMKREIEAHQILLSEISKSIEEYSGCIKSINSPSVYQKFGLRTQMARNLLDGELRVLRSSSDWLKHYCSVLSAQTTRSGITN